MRRSSIGLIVIAVVLVVVLGATAILSAPRPSDHDQIVQQMVVIQAAARARSVAGIMRVVAPDYDDGLCDSTEQLDAMLIHGVRAAQSINTDVSPGTVSVDGNTATSTVRVSATSEGGGSGQTNVQLHWRKERTHRFLIFPDTAWLIVSAEYRADIDED